MENTLFYQHDIALPVAVVAAGVIVLLLHLARRLRRQQAQIDTLYDATRLLTAATAVALDVRKDRRKVAGLIGDAVGRVPRSFGRREVLKMLAEDPPQAPRRPRPVSVEEMSDYVLGLGEQTKVVAEGLAALCVVVRKMQPLAQDRPDNISSSTAASLLPGAAGKRSDSAMISRPIE